MNIELLVFASAIFLIAAALIVFAAVLIEKRLSALNKTLSANRNQPSDESVEEMPQLTGNKETSIEDTKPIPPSQPKPEMTVADFLEKAKSDPQMLESAAQMIYRAVFEEPGFIKISHETNAKASQAIGLIPGQTLNVPKSFYGQFFGRERELAQLTLFMASAAKGAEDARQVFALVGPRGTGKSQMIEFMKRKITGQVIYTLKGCDNNDHPMWITPLNKRNALAEEYGFMPGSTPSALPTHPTFRGDICPQCRLRLEQEYNFEWRKFPVVKRKISSRRGVGIAVVDPVDPNNQDIGVLIGTISIKDLDKYDEGDPRTMVLRGAFNKMNRGIGEFREGWNNDSQYLYPIIFSTQEGTVDSPGQYELVSHDSCQVFHSNMGSWHKFLSDPNSEALIGRVEPILYRHLLRYTEEAKVYEKERQRSLYGRSNISPHTLEALAFHAVITRCDPQIDKPIGYDKALIYDGFGIDPMNTPQKLLQMSPKDGLMGLDSRFFTKVLGEAYARSGGACLIWSDLRNQVSQSLKRNFEVGELTLPEFNYFQEVLAQADVFYLNSLDNDLKFISSKAMQELALNLFYKYCDHLRRWSVRHKARIHSQDESIFPEYSEDVLSVIEKHLGVRANDLDGFREEFVDWLIDYETRNKEQPKWDVHPRLRRAIESVLWTRLQNILRIPQSSALLSEEDALIYRSVVAEMLTRGYHEDCVDRVLASASDLWTT